MRREPQEVVVEVLRRKLASLPTSKELRYVMPVGIQFLPFRKKLDIWLTYTAREIVNALILNEVVGDDPS